MKPWITFRSAWPVIVAAGIGLFLILGLSIRHTKILYLEWMLPLLILALPLLFGEYWRRRRGPGAGPAEPLGSRAGSLVLLGFALLYGFAGTALSRCFYFLDWAPPDGTGIGNWQLGIWHWTLLTLLAWPLFFFWPFRKPQGWLFGVLLAAQVAALVLLLRSAIFQPLYDDDHPSFWYRLWIFGQSFPRLINYSPLWNAGSLEIAGVSTGALAPGLLCWPLWRWGGVLEGYTGAIGILYILLTPALAVLSARLMGLSRLAGWIAGLLALGISRYYFLWLLHYGTVGANLTAAFMLPAAASLYRVVVLNRREWFTGAALALSLLFLWLWPPGVIASLTLGLALLFNWAHWSKAKFYFLAGWAGVAGLLFLYPLLIILRGTDVVSHQWIGSATAAGGWLAVLIEGCLALRARCVEANPLLVFLGLAGLIISAGRMLRRWFLPLLIGLAFLAGWGTRVIPDIQPHRIAIHLFFVAVLPAAALAAEILNIHNQRLALARAALCALLIMTGWNAVRLFRGDGEMGFAHIPPSIQRLAAWVKQNTARGDRIMLAGGTGHHYEGGHVPGLALLFDREMLSSEYRHDQVKQLRYGCPPEEPPPEAGGLNDYLELFAPRFIITPHDDWKQFLRADSARFQEKAGFPGDDSTLAVFQVLQPVSLFARGGGSIRSDLNVLVVTLTDPAAEAVIKYNWQAGLAAAEAEIYPVEAGAGVRWIGIRSRGAALIHIRFQRWL